LLGCSTILTPPWLTHRHTVSFRLAIPLAQTSELIIRW